MRESHRNGNEMLYSKNIISIDIHTIILTCLNLRMIILYTLIIHTLSQIKMLKSVKPSILGEAFVPYLSFADRDRKSSGRMNRPSDVALVRERPRRGIP